MGSSKQHRYTEEEKEFLVAHTDMARSELTLAFNAKFGTDISTEGITIKCLKMGLKASISGRYGEGRHQKKSPLGTEKICQCHILVKTRMPNTWETKQRVVWENANGPVPDGYVLSFKDGDFMNCDIDNIELITFSERCVMNRMGVNEMPDEIKPIARTLAKVKAKIKQRLRDEK